MRIGIDPNLKFTESDVRQIERKNGTLAALEWLALVPPDRFDGDWQKVYDDLEGALYWGCGNGNGCGQTGGQEV